MAVVEVVAPCTLVEVDRYFRGACRIIALMTETSSTPETSVNVYQTTLPRNPDKSSLY
jgi:hypothetical protein